VRTGPWAELGAGASEVRTAVFVEEQRIPREEEWDTADQVALHAVAHNRLGQAMATGRLLPAEGGVSKIGRMAVHRVLRGTGVGRQILTALMDAARTRGDRTVRLSAQRTAEGFYRRLGYTPVGEPYDEVGIPHLLMEKHL
jgi:predicted GNAT family N-acyltransferase